MVWIGHGYRIIDGGDGSGESGRRGLERREGMYLRLVLMNDVFGYERLRMIKLEI